MALNPKLSFLRLGSAASPHVLEIYIDYLCPFSAKIIRSLDANVVPLIKEGGKFFNKFSVIFRLQPQPWHGTSPYLHEAAIAFGLVSPELFWQFSVKLMNAQEQFFDRPSSDKTAVQIRETLAKLGGELLSQDQDKASLLDKITPKSTPNGGVDVTELLKYNIKIGRQNSIHVTPTALFDGLIENSVSSSFGADEWQKFFDDKITA